MTGQIYSARSRDSKYNYGNCLQAPPDLSFPSIRQRCICITHLVAVHLVAIFEAKCFAEGNIDSIANNGHCNRVTYYLREQWEVWGLGGFQTGKKKEMWKIFISDLMQDEDHFMEYLYNIT